MSSRSARTDRVSGVLLGLAAGDALGAGYEFTTPAPDAEIAMLGGGQFAWEPGEWTDDTQLAVCIAEVTATGEVDVNAIAQRFLDWYAGGPKDVGVQTRSVLGRAGGHADRLADVAAEHFAANPRGAAGNGSLMRTAPIALAHLGDDDAIAAAAMAVSGLTHGDPLAGEACVLWCIAIDRGVREARLDGIDDGLALLPADRRGFWSQRITEARTRPPATFTPNGFVVTALQAALAAITQTPIPDDAPWRHLPLALEAAVRIGHDTDTVAAIAGGLLGARWGGSALPFAWRRLLHGWPGYRARDLVRLAVLTAGRGRPDDAGWPSADSLAGYYQHAGHPTFAVALPDDPGLVVGNVAGLPAADIDAVVSLCRVGRTFAPPDVEHLELHFIDTPGANTHLRHVVADTAAGILALREEGKRVFLHCVAGQSRTPAVAAAYLRLRLGISGKEALGRIGDVLYHYQHNHELIDVVRSLPQQRDSNS
ncbi:MAG: ADP-ribosylglycohydrolase family protein [Egibacteraceae bacterium]